MLILIGYSSIGIHDLIDFFLSTSTYSTSTQTLKHSVTALHTQTQCAIVNHINKNTQYKQRMRALFMRQLTDIAMHTHSAHIHVQKGFFRLSPFKCEQSCTLAVSLYECSSSRHCRYAPLFEW